MDAVADTSTGSNDSDEDVSDTLVRDVDIDDRALVDEGGSLDADAESDRDDGLADDGPAEGVHDPDAFDGGADTHDDAGAAVPASVQVLTINLKHPLLGLDDARKRLRIVADTIIERRPDLVALQEVIRPAGEPSFAEQLAEMTGYEGIWEYTFTVPFMFDEGLGILSRWPIAWRGSQALPHLDLVLFQRKVLGAGVTHPRGEIALYCSHMTTDSARKVKADQAVAVFEFIQGHPSPLPGFLAGDLNAEPDSLAMRFFRGEAEHNGLTGDLIDAWLTVNPEMDGFTIESNKPDKRIDYIYQVPGTEFTAEVVSCEIMFSKPVGGLFASDHLGVLCEFLLPSVPELRHVETP
jgi:endonuclease/exonuclease/phosphatase family metal-dependent hydrolase